MPGVSIGIQTKYGFAGQVSRQGYPESRTRPVNASSANIAFGDPVVQNADGSIARFGAGNTPVQFAGVGMRRVKSAQSYPQQGLGYYAPGDNADILECGCISVVCNVGNPTVGPASAVYVRTALNGSIPAGVIGGFEAAADGANSVLLTNCKWGSTKDATGIAELVILTQQGV